MKRKAIIGIMGLLISALSFDQVFANGGDEHGEPASAGAEVIEEGDSQHKSPHGGIVKTLGNRHVELVLIHHGEPKIKVYVLDEKENTISVEGMSAGVYLKLPDGQTQNIALEIVKDSNKTEPAYFESPFKIPQEIEGDILAVVSLTMDGERHNLRYTIAEHKDKKESHSTH